MIQIPGVAIRLLVQDQNAAAEAKIGHDGLVGALLPGTATINVRLESWSRAAVLNIDYRNDAEPRLFADGPADEAGQVVQLQLDANKRCVAPRVGNAVWVLTYELGSVVLYRISLISLGGLFYLVNEEVCRPAIYHDELNHEAVCPFWERNFQSEFSWLTILETMRRLAEPFLDMLPPLSAYTGKEPRLDVSGLSDKQGIVKFWRNKEGWGGVVFPKKGLVRVRRFQVCRKEGGRRYLDPGEKVACARFSDLEPGGQFRFEAEEVMPVPVSGQDGFTARAI